MKIQHPGRDFFSFTRKERIGFLVIAVIIILTWFTPAILARFRPAKNSPDTAWIRAVAQLRQAEQMPPAEGLGDDQAKINISPVTPSKTGEGILFYFDPNKASTADWQRLGIRDKTIRTIQNYLGKGGHFYKADDLAKIYGLHPDEYERLKPYVRIAEAKTNTSSTNPAPDLGDKHFDRSPKYSPVDINSADTAAFIALPGIGSKLASRIVNFREKLGGFYAVDQVGETYGLPDSTFQKIRQYLVLGSSGVKKLNINTATKEELKAHPYIKWNLANVIVEYRSQHGNYSSIEDLKKISLITEDFFNKMKPYLTL